MNVDAFVARRRRVIELMGEGVAVLMTTTEKVRSRDTHFPFRPDSYFHYLTGFGEPEAVLVLVAGDKPRSILFCRDKDADKEIWDGFRWGPAAAQSTFGFDEAFSIKDLAAKLPELIANQNTLWHAVGYEQAADQMIADALNVVRGQCRTGKRAPSVLRDFRATLDEMRLIKDDAEIALMRQAAVISAEAHCRAMRATRPGLFEYEIEAELLHEFRRKGSQYPAYTSIVASGPGACVLHYVDNNRQMQDGELVLIDAGCELAGYAGDITRTFPVNGKFSGPQADVYQIVLEAQRAAIAAIRPGVSFMAPHEAALRILTQGMIDLHLVNMSLDEAIATEAYKPFYMHRTSHWLGADVHDAGDYKLIGQCADAWRPLAPGMALTVEPGCYIRPAANVPEIFWNIGVRIEDDIVVTERACEVLSEAAPKDIAAIETLMSERSA